VVCAWRSHRYRCPSPPPAPAPGSRRRFQFRVAIFAIEVLKGLGDVTQVQRTWAPTGCCAKVHRTSVLRDPYGIRWTALAFGSPTARRRQGPL
jgi:hypothetical protein